MNTSMTHWQAARAFIGFFSPRYIIAIMVGGLILRCVIGNWSVYDLIAIASVAVLWPIQEWIIHIAVLHGKPIKILGHTIDLEIAKTHRDHHAHPERIDDVMLTPVVVVQASIAAAILWFSLCPYPISLTGFVSYMAAAAHYEWCHYCAHAPLKPRTMFYRALKRHHMLHHHKNENYWFGITGNTGDKLMGTNPDPKNIQQSDSCKTL